MKHPRCGRDNAFRQLYSCRPQISTRCLSAHSARTRNDLSEFRIRRGASQPPSRHAPHPPHALGGAGATATIRRPFLFSTVDYRKSLPLLPIFTPASPDRSVRIGGTSRFGAFLVSVHPALHHRARAVTVTNSIFRGRIARWRRARVAPRRIKGCPTCPPSIS